MIASTVRKLGIEVDDAIEIGEKLTVRRHDAMPPQADAVTDHNCATDLMAANVSLWDGMPARMLDNCTRFERPHV